MKANLLHTVFFSQANTLVHTGRQRALEPTDAPELTEAFDPAHTADVFDTADASVFTRFLLQMYRGTGAAGRRVLILSIVYLACILSSPLLLAHLLSVVAQPHNTVFELYGIAIALGVTGLCSALAIQHYYYNALQGYAAIVNGLNKRIVLHALRLRHSARNAMQTGDLVNHLSSDTDAIAEAALFLPECITSALRTVVGIAMLWLFLGPATLASVLCLVILSPLAIAVARRYRRLDHHLMETRDERVTLMSQILQGIRVVKYQVWEDSVHQQVAEVRRREIGTRIRIITTDAISTALFVSVTTLVAFVGFASFVWMGGTLTAPIVFACLSLFALLEEPFGMISHLLANVQHARVATSRLQSYFQAPTHTTDQRETSAPLYPVGLEADNLCLRYVSSSTDALHNVTLSIPAGKATAIVGAVGAGKSTLLRTLAQLHRIDSGSLLCTNIPTTVAPRIAYVPQEAFILNASIQDNITFGAADIANEAELHSIIADCALQSDVSTMAAGLRTEIGERGVNLSGGQKHRVSLARAAWQQPGIVFLDDPLSAVDVHTEQKLVDALLFGRWNAITRVVVTHRTDHLSRFDQVVIMDNGRVVTCGAPSEVAHLLTEYVRNADEHTTVDKVHANVPTFVHEPVPHCTEPTGHDTIEERFTVDEDSDTGAVRPGVYKSYITALLGKVSFWRPFVAVAMLTTTAMVTFLPILQTWWLGHWTDQSGGKSSQSALYAVSVFGLLGIVVLVAWVGERIVWLGRAAKAGMVLHDAALQGVLNAQIRFFDTTPIGRILNRFSRDQEAVDDHLSWNLEQSFKSLMQTAGSLLLVLVVVPWLSIMMIPVLWMYYRLQRDYRSSAREAKRMESVARSPRYAHFKELVSGLDVIHGFGREEWFIDTFTDILRKYQRAYHCSILLNRWFSTRVALLSSIISLCTCIGVVSLLHHNVIAVGVAGLVLTYALSFWGNLNWAVRAFSEVESRMTAVERLASYRALPAEQLISKVSEPTVLPLQNSVNQGVAPSNGQPIIHGAGRIEVKNLSVRYHHTLPMVLKDITLTIPSRSKVGIVGRTGSGKSTLFQSLFRFIEPTDGTIFIDGIDYREIPLTSLRRAIAIIPQDPTLFLGTVRSNLDRYSERTDEQVWEALRRVRMERFIQSIDGGLSAPIIEGGLNVSQGQRQLLCMARALLADTRIIVLDEATASVDHRTDMLVQQTIRSEFDHATVLIIAHRLDTVADCDQIVELRDGRIRGITWKDTT